jgi:nucleoside-diphosphate kinase
VTAAVERTLVLVKPDGVARGLSGEIIRRIESKGYRISALRMQMADPELLARHYAEHVGKPFYQPLVEFMLSGPIVSLVAEGHRVIEGFRLLAGPRIRPWPRPAPSAVTSAGTGGCGSSRT